MKSVLIKLLLIFVIQHTLFAEEPLRVGTWNVHNYLTGHRWKAGEFTPFYPKPESEKKIIRRLIHETDLDLLFLQEIGSLGHLEELQRDLRLEGNDFPFLYVNHGNAPRKLGVLSKLPLRQIIDHWHWRHFYRGEWIPMSRSPLEWTINWKGYRIRFFGVHLKSRYTEHDDDPQGGALRQLEMQQVISYITAPITDDSLTILWGDFNSPPNDLSLRPKNHQLLQTHGFTQLRPFDEFGDDWTYEYWKTKTREAVDHIWIQQPNPTLSIKSAIIPTPQEATDHRLVIMEIHVENKLK